MEEAIDMAEDAPQTRRREDAESSPYISIGIYIYIYIEEVIDMAKEAPQTRRRNDAEISPLDLYRCKCRITHRHS